MSLALFLTFQLSKYFDCGTTRAAELAGIMVIKPYRESVGTGKAIHKGVL